MKSEKDEILREIIAYCEQEADKQNDLYHTTYGDERVRADAAGDAYWAVAGHCKTMLGYSGSMQVEVENQSEDARQEKHA